MFLTSLLNISSAASPPATSLKDIIEQEQNQATLCLDSPDEVHFTSALVRFYDNCTCYTQECSIGTMTIGPSIQRLLIRYSLTQKREYAYPLSYQRPNHFPKYDKSKINLCYAILFIFSATSVVSILYCLFYE